MPLLDIQNLVVSYGMITALHGISLRVEQGEVVTLIGSNGAGKSTLLRTISGLLKPKAGTITFNNAHALHNLQPHEIVRVGVSHSPEGRQVFANLTIRENLLLGAYQRRDKLGIQADMQRSFELFPILKERLNQKSGTLSGGEQQMLAMARALMARPKLLLLDEPSLGLAPLIVKKIFEIIKDLRAQINKDTGQGVTIFLVEQNAHMALKIADRAYVLQTGKIIQEAPAQSLLNDPAIKAAYLGG